MNKLIPALLTTLILSLSSMYAQAGNPCSRGDTRCAADGLVQSCEYNSAFNSTYWFTNPSKKCANTSAGCTSGDQKCGEAGFVLECHAGGKWESKAILCKK